MPDQDLLRTVPPTMVGSDWRECVAAIHFNVPRNKALQVLVSGQLKDALLAGKSDRLEELTRIPGFTKLVEKQLETSCTSWVQSESPNIAKVSATLSGVKSASDPSWERTWTLLGQAAVKVTSWPGFNAEIANGMIHLITRYKGAELVAALITSVANSVPQQKDANPTERAQLEPWANGCISLLTDLRARNDELLSSSFSVDTGGASYVNLMILLTSNPNASTVIHYFRPQQSPQTVIETLMKVVGEGNLDQQHRDAISGMLLTRAEWGWDALTSAISTRLQTTSSIAGQELSSLLFVLNKLQNVSPLATQSFATLTSNGFVSSHLYAQQSDPTVVALCVLAMLEHTPSGAPQQNVGNSTAGTSYYNSLLSAPSSNPLPVKEFASMAIVLDKLDVLYRIANQHQNTQEFIKAVFEEVLSEVSGYKRIHPKSLLENEPFFRQSLKPTTYQSFVSASARDSSLISTLIQSGFDVSRSHLYLAVLKAASDPAVLNVFLTEGLRSVSSPDWSTELIREGDLVELAIELGSHRAEPNLTHALEDALVAHARGLLDGSAKITRFVGNWSALLNLLERSFQYTILRKLCDLMIKATGSAEMLLTVYGDRLLADEDTLLRNKDELVLYAFGSFLQRQNSVELSWMSRVLEKYPTLLHEVEKNARLNFSTRLKAAVREPSNSEVEQTLRKVARVCEIDVDVDENTELEGQER